MKYFVNSPYTSESLKNEFRTLCKQLHPDTGGDAEAFKNMMAEYKQIARTVGADSKATAEDFADIMRTPLNGTKGKTFADLVTRLVDVLSSEELTAEYRTAGDLSHCYGWDGSALSPVSRSAYCRKFSAALVELAEVAAAIRIKKEAGEYEASHHAAHMREARKHQAEGCKAPNVGAFVFAIHSGLKSDGGSGIFEEFEALARDPEWMAKKEEKPHLCKVCRVFVVGAEDFARPELADELVEKACKAGDEFPGGAGTDDPERHDRRDEYRYYFTECAAVVCRETGRWFLINSEGYSYARYCMAPTNWRTMYAAEIAAAVIKEDERRAAEEKRQAEEKAARLAEYRAKCEKYAGKMEELTPYIEAVKEARAKEYEAGAAHGYRSPEYKAAGKETRKAEAAKMAAEKRNILAMAAAIYPGIKAKVTKGERWRGHGYVITYYDGPKLEEFEKNTDFDLFSTYWEEYRQDDCTEYHREEFTEFADKYTGGGFFVSVSREWSKETRARLLSLVLDAVPASAGCCWENRYKWTREDLQRVAEAVGLDSWDVIHEYERKQSFFNFVDAEALADWCFCLIAFDTEAPEKPGKRQKAEKPAESKAAEETPATAGESEPTAEGLTMEKYSEKATVIRGYNEQQAAELEALGGKECRRLRGGKGYIFSTRRHGEALAEWFNSQTAAPSETEKEEEAGRVSEIRTACADLLGILSDITEKVKRFEGVTIPAETLAKWREQAENEAGQAAGRLCEVCACLASLTPKARQDFDALGVIFWTLSEQLRNGTTPEAITPATEYAAAQLYDLIDRTQTPQQAAAIREATQYKKAV